MDRLNPPNLRTGSPTIVFTQYRETGELLVRHFAEQLAVDAPFFHGGLSASRRDELVRKAEDAIAEVKESGEEFAFKAMNSFERKIIHDQVAKAGLVSESEGEGDGRHVVVRPADD